MIDVSGLRYGYPGRRIQVLHGLEFTVEDGEVFGFLGPSGAGKSTTQKILTGGLRGWTGSVAIRGEPLAALDADYRERIGVSFEFPNVYTKLTARENLRFFASLYRGPTRDIADLLQMVGLRDVADERAATFSKGMRMRLNLCRAFLNRPELVFLDEPTSGQDPVNARLIKDLVRREAASGTTVFITTHDMTVATEVCDRVAFIIDGSIARIDSPRNLMLQQGQRTVLVEHRQNGHVTRTVFPLQGLGDNAAFLDLVRGERIETMHTQEATLEDVFIAVTGRELA